MPYFANSQHKNKHNKNMEWSELKTKKYSIQHPSDWELDQSGEMGTDFIMFTPLDSEEDQFRENVNLMIQDLSAYNLDLDQYTEISVEQIKTVFINPDILESKKVKTTKGEYHYVNYTGDQGQYQLHFIQYYWVIGKEAYILTFTCEIDKFDAYKEIGAKILNSFKLI